MRHIKARYLNGQRGTGHHASFDGIPEEALAANDIVIATGYDGDRIKWSKADANTTRRYSGVMGIADHAAPTAGDRVRVVSHKLITGVDTDASGAVGAVVYLSDTAGGWSVSAGTREVCVGTVVSDHATTGAVLLAPAHVACAYDGDGDVEVA